MHCISHMMQLFLQLGFNVVVWGFFKNIFTSPKTPRSFCGVTFNWKLEEDVDLPLLVPVCRAAGTSGINARINPSSLWTTQQQGILPPKAKSTLYQLSTNLHHKEHFRMSELRAQHRHCSRVEANDRRERMQHLQFFSPIADLLRKCILQVKSGLKRHHLPGSEPVSSTSVRDKSASLWKWQKTD